MAAVKDRPNREFDEYPLAIDPNGELVCYDELPVMGVNAYGFMVKSNEDTDND